MVTMSPSQREAPVQKWYFYTFASLYRPWSLDTLNFSMRSRICVIDCIDQLPWIWELAVYITKKRLFPRNAFSSHWTLSEQHCPNKLHVAPRLQSISQSVRASDRDKSAFTGNIYEVMITSSWRRLINVSSDALLTFHWLFEPGLA